MPMCLVFRAICSFAGNGFHRLQAPRLSYLAPFRYKLQETLCLWHVWNFHAELRFRCSVMGVVRLSPDYTS